MFLARSPAALKMGNDSSSASPLVTVVMNKENQQRPGNPSLQQMGRSKSMSAATFGAQKVDPFEDIETMLGLQHQQDANASSGSVVCSSWSTSIRAMHVP